MSLEASVRSLLKDWIDFGRISGAAAVIERGGETVCSVCEGYADIAGGKTVRTDTIFRLASMSKPVIAAAILQLIDRGLLSPDTPLSELIGGFSEMRVWVDPYDMADTRTRPAENTILIRDLLTHSCGLGQIYEAFPRLARETLDARDTLDVRIGKLSAFPLDFEPGTDSGYSAAAAFDILGFIIEKLSGKPLETYLKENIFDPLGIEDLGFVLTPEQRGRTALLYGLSADGLTDMSATEPLWILEDPYVNGCCSGSAGLQGSADAYMRFAHALACGGSPILRGESVELMRSSLSRCTKEYEPGARWGAGVLVCDDPVRAKRPVGRGTFGWSGAYGTHFWVDPENGITAVLGVNQADLDGSDSDLSRGLERVVWEYLGKN